MIIAMHLDRCVAMHVALGSEEFVWPLAFLHAFGPAALHASKDVELVDIRLQLPRHDFDSSLAVILKMPAWPNVLGAMTSSS